MRSMKNDPPSSADPAAILRTRDVLPLVGVARTTLWSYVRDGFFPRPLRLGGPKSRAVGWRRADVERWLSERPAA